MKSGLEIASVKMGQIWVKKILIQSRKCIFQSTLRHQNIKFSSLPKRCILKWTTI